MKKWLNGVLNVLPFNGHKLNIGLALGALLQLLPNLKTFLPPGYAELIDAGIILLGALHKFVKN